MNPMTPDPKPLTKEMHRAVAFPQVSPSCPFQADTHYYSKADIKSALSGLKAALLKKFPGTYNDLLKPDIDYWFEALKND